jgi:hypothetical protein
MTETRLLVTHHRLQTYWNRHGKVPGTPAELPLEKGRDCSTIDGWGRELHWDSDDTGKVKVWSLGRDGNPGGIGEDADLEVEFAGTRSAQDDLLSITRRNGLE